MAVTYCRVCHRQNEGGCFRANCPVGDPPTRAQDDAQLLHEVEAFLRRKYVTSADKRQRDLGLSYVTAETKDLAKEISRFIREWEKKQ